MTARTAAAAASFAPCAHAGRVHELLRSSDRDAYPAKDGRVAVPARLDRRVPRRRVRGRGCESRDGAAASQPAPIEIFAPRDRRRRAAPDRAGERAAQNQPARPRDAGSTSEGTTRRKHRHRQPTARTATPPPTNGQGTTESRAGAAAEQTRIKDEKDLQPLEGIFANVDFWKKIGEEYQNPLIVTGR